MSWAWSVWAAASLLLVVAGAPRALAPAGTVRAAQELGLGTLPPAFARGVGVAEAGLGLTVLLLGGPVAALAVALVYVGFAALTWRGLSTGAGSCGCFVGADAAPTPQHVVLDLVLAAAAATAASDGAPGVVAVLRDGGTSAGPLLGVALLDAALVYLVLTRSPAPAVVPR
ncbi:MAG: hypothetical protein JWL64_1179 [Frankiales bacterium]|nr:hypothetical protein [Frankiales bacterium]